MSTSTEHAEIVKALAAPFFEHEGIDRVFVAHCCGRYFVGPIAAGKCKTCGKPVTSETLDRVSFGS